MSQFDLPKGWLLTSLGEIADWGSGGTPSRKTESYYGGTIPWVKTGDLGPKVLTQASEFITEQAVANSSAKFFPKGSVAIAMYGATIGKTSILGIDATTNQACGVGNPIKGVTFTEFLYYMLCNEKDNFIAKGKGGAQPNISQALIKEHEIALPPLAEQQQIAQKLDELLAQVDTLKTRLDAIPKILKRFRQSVLTAAVSGRLTEACEQVTNLTIGDVAEDIRYGTSKKCDESLGATPVLRIPNIGDKGIDLTNLKYADFEDSELEKLKLQVGDILIIRSNGSVDLVGKAALVRKESEHCLFAGYLIRIRFNLEQVVPEYVLMCIQSVQTRKIIELQARSTSGVNNINSQELAAIPLAIPSLSKQTEIVRRVEQLFAYADQIEQRVKDAQARVNHLTQSILAKAFRGELTAEWRAQNPDLISGENSAAALLERIKAEREAAVKPKRKSKI